MDKYATGQLSYSIIRTVRFHLTTLFALILICSSIACSQVDKDIDARNYESEILGLSISELTPCYKVVERDYKVHLVDTCDDGSFKTSFTFSLYRDFNADEFEKLVEAGKEEVIQFSESVVFDDEKQSESSDKIVHKCFFQFQKRGFELKGVLTTIFYKDEKAVVLINCLTPLDKYESVLPLVDKAVFETSVLAID